MIQQAKKSPCDKNKMLSQSQILAELNYRSWTSTNELSSSTGEGATMLSSKLGKLWRFGLIEQKRKVGERVYFWRRKKKTKGEVTKI